MFPLPLLLLEQRARLRRGTHADDDSGNDNRDPPRLASTAATALLAKLPKGFHADRHLFNPLADLVESTPAAHPILDAALVHALHSVHRVVNPQPRRSASTDSDHAALADVDLDRALALLQALLDRVVQVNPPEPLALLRRFLATVADLDLELPDAMVQQLNEYFYSWFQARHHADFIPLFVAWLTSQNGRVMTLYVREYDWDDLFTLLQTRFDAAAPLLTTMATVLRRVHGVRGTFLAQGGIMVAKLLLRRVHRDPRHKRDLLVILNLFKGLVPRNGGLDLEQGVEGDDEDRDSVGDPRNPSTRPFTARTKTAHSLRRSSTSSSAASTSSDTIPPRRPRRPGAATLLPRESRTRKPRYPLPDPRGTTGTKTPTDADTTDTTDRSPSPSRRKSIGTTLSPRRATDPPSRSSRAPSPRPPSSLDQSTTDIEPASKISSACLALLARLRSRTPWFDDLLAFVSRAALTLDDAFEIAERVHTALRAVLDDAPDAVELVASVQVAVEREDPDSDAADLFVMQCLRILHALATNIDVGSANETDPATSPPVSTQPSLNASLNTSQRAGARPASASFDVSGSSTKSSKDKPAAQPDLSTPAGLATLLAGSRAPQAPLYRLPALPNDDPATQYAAHFALKSRLIDLGFLDTLMTCLESYNVDVLLATAAGVQAFSVDPTAGKAILCLRSESAGVGRDGEEGMDGCEGGAPLPSRAGAFASNLSLGVSEFDLFGEPMSATRAAAGKSKKSEPKKKGAQKSNASKKSVPKRDAATKESKDGKTRPTSSSASRPASASKTTKPPTGTNAKSTKSARSTPAPSRPASAAPRRSPQRGSTAPTAPTAPSPTVPVAAAILVPRPLAPAHECAHVLDMLHVLRHSHHPVLQRHARAAFWSLCRVGTRRTNQVALELVQDGIWGRILAGV
ncbi:hypothetical protein GGF32_003962 [Allomyces javanicus]|nr:hypothetical protein GGF32_003962 [Allomyces javanicus]